MKIEPNAAIVLIAEPGEIPTFYNVMVRWVPQKGEIIDLWSLVDQEDGHPPQGHYEVMQVVHKLYDHSDRHPRKPEDHFVSIYVKPAKSKD